ANVASRNLLDRAATPPYPGLLLNGRSECLLPPGEVGRRPDEGISATNIRLNGPHPAFGHPLPGGEGSRLKRDGVEQQPHPRRGIFALTICGFLLWILVDGVVHAQSTSAPVIVQIDLDD